MELLDPDRLGRARRVNLERDLVDDVQAEIFQHGQDVGERHRLAAPECLKAELVVLVCGNASAIAIGVLYPFYQFQIASRNVWRKSLKVAIRKRGGDAFAYCRAPLSRILRCQGSG